MEAKDRWYWSQNPNNSIYNDGEWRVKLPNGKNIGVNDQVLVKFSNGNFIGTVKQVSGFGWKEDRPVISVIFPGKSNGKKVHIDYVLDKI